MASSGVRQHVLLRSGPHVSAWPPPASGDAGAYQADPGEGAFHPIAAIERKLPRERAAHDVIAGPQTLAEFGELAGQPDDRIEGVAQHGIAAAGGGLDSVNAHPGLDLAQLR